MFLTNNLMFLIGFLDLIFSIGFSWFLWQCVLSLIYDVLGNQSYIFSLLDWCNCKENDFVFSLLIVFRVYGEIYVCVLFQILFDMVNLSTTRYNWGSFQSFTIYSSLYRTAERYSPVIFEFANTIKSVRHL